MDGRLVAGVIVAIVLIGVLALMLTAWRRRLARDAELGQLTLVPDPRPRPDTTLTVLYVATSKHDQPLERLALPGLGYRARVSLELSASGVVIDIPGERPTYIPASSIVGIDQTNLTIDRVVEPGGLIRLSWRVGDELIVDSTFRVLEQSDRARLIDAVTTLSTTRDAAAAASAPPDNVAAAPTADDRTPSHNESAS